MGSGEHLGVRVDVPRIAVDHECTERERRRSQQPAAHVELPPAREVRRRGTAGRTGSGSGRTSSAPRPGSRPRGARSGSPRRRPHRTGTPRASRRSRVSARRRRSRGAASTAGRCARARTRATGCRRRPSASRRRGTPRRPSRPASFRSAIWSRRWSSSSSTSRPLTPGAPATYARHSAICSSTPHASTAASRQTSFSARVTASHCFCWSASAARPSSVIT